MKYAIEIIQITLAILLAVLILMQGRGAGLGGSFGGAGELYKSKRGVEKLLFRATIAIIILFFLMAIVNMVVK